MSILGTGRTNLAQADYASKASTGMANARAANQANIDIGEQNSKQSMRGQALGSLGSAGLAAYGATAMVRDQLGLLIGSSCPDPDCFCGGG